MRLPSVVSLKTYVKPSRFPAFTRFNVFLRDRFTCQYCGARDDLTFDHVVPRSKGGVTSWENVVAACSACNLRKADLLPATARMFPARTPYQPTVHDLHQNGRAVPAELSARELDGLSLLGQRAGAVESSSDEASISGRLTSEPGLRRIGALPYPYVIYYEVIARDVVVVGVRHDARKPAAAKFARAEVRVLLSGWRREIFLIERMGSRGE